jgi:AcrR family transcriptional regulator
MIHLMSPREQQRADTRRRIVEAVAALITDEHPAAISVPAVARRAGVGVATVYRYFPTKEALLDAAVMIGNEATWQAIASSGIDLRDAPTLVARSYAELAQHLDLARNQMLSPAGRAMRRRRRVRKRALLESAAIQRGLDPADPGTERLLVLVELLASASALLELHDQLELDPSTAAAHVGWAIEHLVLATEHEQSSAPPRTASDRGATR